MTTNTIVPGSGVTVTCTNGACTVNSTGGGGSSISVYPATATASFPYGFSVTTFTATSTGTVATLSVTQKLISIPGGRIFFGTTGIGDENLSFGTTGGGFCANTGGTVCDDHIGTIGIGFDAATGNLIGTNNIAIGSGALGGGVTGSAAFSNNIAIGQNALNFADTPTTGNSIAIGQGAIAGHSGAFTAGEVTAVGGFSNWNNINGLENAGFGYHTLMDNQTGNANTAIGSFALEHAQGGTTNVAIGHSAGGGGDNALAQSLVTGNNNIFIGYKATVVSSTTLAQDLIVIGRGATAGTSSLTPLTINNAIAIGKNSVVNTSNTMVIGGTGTDSMGVQMTSVTVTYNVTAGSITGAGLGTCGDGTHALNYALTTGLFGCQTLTTGGGGSASTLAVGTGTASGFSGTITSSPTAIVLADQSQFNVTLQGGATAFLTLQASISSVSNNFTIGSTSTVVMANCSSACTITLPTAVGITGRVLTVKRTSTAAVTIATTSAQTIDGAATQVLVQQYTSVDMISDGANWSLL